MKTTERILEYIQTRIRDHKVMLAQDKEKNEGAEQVRLKYCLYNLQDIREFIIDEERR